MKYLTSIYFAKYIPNELFNVIYKHKVTSDTVILRRCLKYGLYLIDIFFMNLTM